MPAPAEPGQTAAEGPEQAAAAKFLSTAPEQSVAVLPFVAMSSGQDDEYFADGITEAQDGAGAFYGSERLQAALAQVEADGAVAILDAPLVYEWGIEDWFQRIVVVTVDAERAAQRVAGLPVLKVNALDVLIDGEVIETVRWEGRPEKGVRWEMTPELIDAFVAALGELGSKVDLGRVAALNTVIDDQNVERAQLGRQGRGRPCPEHLR